MTFKISLISTVLLFALCDFEYRVADAQQTKALTAVVKVKTERQVASAVSGVIETSTLVEGAKINEGDLLFTIDAKQAELELQRLHREHELAKRESESEVDILFAEKSIRVAQSELRRAREANLRLPGAVSMTEMEKLVLIVEKTMAEKEKAVFQKSMKSMLSKVRESELSIGKQKLQRHKVHSPIPGSVVEVLKKQGEWVSESEVVARVMSLDKLIVEVNLKAGEALVRLAERKATFVPAESLNLEYSKEFNLKLLFVHPEVNPVNHLVKVWYELDNEDLLLVPGVSGKVTVESGLQQIAESSDE